MEHGRVIGNNSPGLHACPSLARRSQDVCPLIPRSYWALDPGHLSFHFRWHCEASDQPLTYTVVLPLVQSQPDHVTRSSQTVDPGSQPVDPGSQTVDPGCVLLAFWAPQPGSQAFPAKPSPRVHMVPMPQALDAYCCHSAQHAGATTQIQLVFSQGPCGSCSQVGTGWQPSPAHRAPGL